MANTMTVSEARREINRANSKIYRLNKGRFEGDTPASKVLRNDLKRLGVKSTEKGYISTKGLSSQEIISAGIQARKFSGSKTSSTRGALQDIETRLGTWSKKARDIVKQDLTQDTASRIWRIFDRSYYKRMKEQAGSDAVVALVLRKLAESPDIDINNWLYRREKAYRDGLITQEELLFSTGKRGSSLDNEDEIEDVFGELE